MSKSNISIKINENFEEIKVKEKLESDFLKESIESTINSTRYKPIFSYKTKSNGYQSINSKGFILSNEHFNFKYPFVEETFKDFFHVTDIMNVLINKTNDLKKTIYLKYSVTNNEINMFEIFKIKVLENDILINYVSQTIVLNYEKFYTMKVEDKKLIFKDKNDKKECFNIDFKESMEFILSVYNEKNKNILQNVTIIYDHDYLVNIFIEVVFKIIAYKLEKIEKNNKIKIINL